MASPRSSLRLLHSEFRVSPREAEPGTLKMREGSPSGRTPGLTALENLIATARAYLVPFLLLLLFAWMVLHGLETVRRIMHYYNPLPVWDYWRVPEHFSQYKSFDVRVLWKQHNEHRIVFPEIVFAADTLLWHGRMILPLAASFICYLATWLVLLRTFVSERQLSPALRSAAVFLTGVLVLWEGSATVLGTPLLLQWTLMQLAAMCSLVWVSRVKNALGNGYLAGTIAAAVIATYSSGNGMFLWIVLLGAALVLRVAKRQLAVIGVAGTVSVGLYFVGYQFSRDTNFRNLLLHPLYFLGFATSYLSMPLGGMKTPSFAVSVGLMSLLVMALLCSIAARNGLLRSEPGIVFFGSYAFALLTIVITAAGRMAPSDPTFFAAKQARYLTVPLMNWAVFIFACIWVSTRCHWKFVNPPALAIVFGVLLMVALPKLRWWLADDAGKVAEQQLAALGIEDGLRDTYLIGKIFPDPGFVLHFLPEMRENHLSIYYKPRDKWLGRPLETFSPLHSNPIPGEITYTYPLHSGFEVAGWADESAERRSYDWVVLANEGRQIVGFGRRIPAGFPDSARGIRTPPSLGWVGFVNLSVKTKSVFAYVLDSHRRGLFPIAGSFPVPLLAPATLDEAGASIPGITWQKDPSWMTGGLPLHVDFGAAPAGPVYSSWGGSDAHTGKMSSSPFAAPASGCLILPVLHGPSADGLSVDLRNAATGEVMASAPMQSRDTQWEYWRVSIDESVKHLLVDARDEGRDWGQWVAVAVPLQCR